MPYVEERTWNFAPGQHRIAKVFDAEECRRIIDYNEACKVRETVVKAGNASYRNTDVHWLHFQNDDYKWIYERVGDISRKFNAETYQFEFDRCTDLQLARYTVDQHYDWHTDLGADGYSRRKLSIALMLSDRADFEGGELQFGGAQFTRSAEVEQGDAILFPAWARHRVTPVTSGERWTLVGWWLGPPFR